MKKFILAAVAVTVVVVGIFFFMVYKIGEEQTYFRCGCGKC